MLALKEFIATQRRSRSTERKPLDESTANVRAIRSEGLRAATVAFPADLPLEERVARMNEFWRTLVEYQHRDVVVVALCATSEP